MTRRDPRYSVGLDVNPGRGTDPGRPIEERPFRVAIMGAFRSAGGPGLGDAGRLSERRPVEVDRDNVDQVLARMAPRVRIALPNRREEIIGFTELEDFHPDRLYVRLPLLAPFRELRREVSDPARFAATVKHPESAAIPGDLLEQIIEQSPSDAEDLPAFIQRAVAPHLVPEVTPQQATLVRQVDAAIAALLRLVLHHPDFQALESLWRSINFLVRRVETSANLQIHLLHVSRAELEADLRAPRPAEETDLYQALVGSSDGSSGGESWSLLVGAYTFGHRAGDIALLAQVANAARAMGAPWISAAHPRLVGCESVDYLRDPRRWSLADPSHQGRLRRSAQACWLGLALPRFLLRLPYGPHGEECEELPGFEELTHPLGHEELLWGNPAITCALLLAQSFEAAGWGFRPGMHRELTGLPLYLRRRNGETEATPCAEVLLSDASLEHLLHAGIMPLASRKDGDAVRLIRFQSIAEPLAPLAGRWVGETGNSPEGGAP